LNKDGTIYNYIKESVLVFFHGIFENTAVNNKLRINHKRFKPNIVNQCQSIRLGFYLKLFNKDSSLKWHLRKLSFYI